jgi:hypothetical protein
MLNSASKCLKITIKVIKFSKPGKISQKSQVERGISPLSHLRGLSPIPTLAETLEGF